MKHTLRIFTVFLLSFGLAYALRAQETNRARLGVKAGFNYSNLYTNDSDHSKTHPGLNVGLFASLPITQWVSLQPELYYTTKGADVTYNNAFVNGTASFNLNYLEVPLLLAVRLANHVNLHFGPYAAVLISGKVTNKSNATLFDFEKNLNVDDYNRLDAGLAAGIGLNFGPLNIGARYNYGLTKVGKDHTFLGTRYRFPDAVNGVFNVYVAVSLL